MQGNHCVDAFQGIVVDHGRSATNAILVRCFLRWLKQQANAAVPVVCCITLSQQMGNAKQDRRVRIVTTGMHDTRIARTVWHVIGFEDGQGIHVGANRNDWP